MNCVDVGLLCDPNDGGNIEISPNRLARFTNLISLVRFESMKGVSIFVGVDCNGANVQLMSRPTDTNRDFTPVGNQQLLNGLHAAEFSFFGSTMSGAIQQRDWMQGYGGVFRLAIVTGSRTFIRINSVRIGSEQVGALDGPARRWIIPSRPNFRPTLAGVTQWVEYHVANVVVVGSSPITRSLFCSK